MEEAGAWFQACQASLGLLSCQLCPPLSWALGRGAREGSRPLTPAIPPAACASRLALLSTAVLGGLCLDFDANQPAAHRAASSASSGSSTACCLQPTAY